MTARLVFLDMQTTGLHPWVHEPWEIAVIERRTIIHADQPAQVVDVETVFHVRPDLTKADPNALRLNDYYERTAPFDDYTRQFGSGVAAKPGEGWLSPAHVARVLAQLLAGAHVVGINPASNVDFLQRFLHKHGQAAAWHYHLIDARALAIGFLYGIGDRVDPSESTDAVMHRLGLERLPGRHTALGDARLARTVYDAVTTDVRQTVR